VKEYRDQGKDGERNTKIKNVLLEFDTSEGGKERNPAKRKLRGGK